MTIHPLDPEDAVITAAMRAMVSPSKGARAGIEARASFDARMERVAQRQDVAFEADTVGGVAGLWVNPVGWPGAEGCTDCRALELVPHASPCSRRS